MFQRCVRPPSRWWSRQYAPLKHQSSPMRLHGSITQKALMFTSCLMTCKNKEIKLRLLSYFYAGQCPTNYLTVPTQAIFHLFAKRLFQFSNHVTRDILHLHIPDVQCNELVYRVSSSSHIQFSALWESLLCAQTTALIMKKSITPQPKAESTYKEWSKFFWLFTL
jgi:hypothetical protein